MVMDAAGLTLVIANLILGLGGAALLARPLAEAKAETNEVRWNFGLLIGVYVIESAAVCASMATMFLNIALAFVWAVVLGRWLRRSGAPVPQARRTAFTFAVYGSLPALSLVLIPIVAALCGRNVLSVQEAVRFGIPAFVPWPLNSILGFFGSISVTAVILKVLITTTGVRRLTAHRIEHPSA
jgi:hypothetical protein